MPHLTENSSPDGRGPWMLRFSGMWGTGKRSKIWVQDADVIDLSASVDHEPRELRGNRHLRARQFVDNITEDVEPDEGLDVQFGDQVLQAPRDGGTTWNVTDPPDFLEPIDASDSPRDPVEPSAVNDG